MTALPILRWPDPRLSAICAPVEAEDDTIARLAEDMLETLYAASGRGLAAPQVGVLKRVFVMDATWKEGQPKPQVFINPQIVAQGAAVVCQPEGCLSLPGVTAEVTRPARVVVQWQDLGRAAYQQELTGFEARCAQHELDHLDGRMTLDRLEPEDRARVLSSYGQVPA